jgi:hypothetical protein
MVMELAAVLPAIGAAAAICEVLFLVFGELGRRKGNETEKKEGGIRMGGRAVHSISVATFWDAWRAVDAEDASREIVRVIARLFHFFMPRIFSGQQEFCMYLTIKLTVALYIRAMHMYSSLGNLSNTCKIG